MQTRSFIGMDVHKATISISIAEGGNHLNFRLQDRPFRDGRRGTEAMKLQMLNPDLPLTELRLHNAAHQIWFSECSQIQEQLQLLSR